jgi:hypothetical protein
MNSLPDEAEYYTRLPNDATPFDNLQTYKIIGQFLLGPIEMIKNRIVGFNISLEGGAEPEEFISIESLKLTTVEYSEKRTEVIKVWERKYLASSFNNSSDFNLDTSDNLRSSTDGYNAGLYFPFKGAGDISRPEEEIFSFNKTKAVSAGLYYSSSEEVEISYDTLHEIESTEQKRLYEFATELDESGDDWTYTGIVPYRVAPFLESIDVEWKEREAQYLAEILPWEKHSKVVGFKQYDFWRPGGHRYEWNLDDVDHRKCMLFGGLKYFITARFIHVDHTGIGTPLGDDGSTPIDPGNSYYSLRFYTQVAKYDRAQILAGGDPGELDLWSVGGASITSFAPAEEIQPVPGG